MEDCGQKDRAGDVLSVPEAMPLYGISDRS